MASFTRTSAGSIIHHVQQGLSTFPVELVYTPHDRWPIPHPRHAPPANRPLRILVLDSSYNPPTLAHLALANSRRPSYTQHSEYTTHTDSDTFNYDAKLLLLSVRNADKALKPADASYIQRLEMMTILAKNIVGHDSDIISAPEQEANVAVAVIDEPTFVGKSSTLHTFLQSRFASLSTATSSQKYEAQLTFLLGFDTLERFLLPRYYGSESQMLSSFRKLFSPPPEGDDSYFVCAHRPTDASTGAGGVSTDSVSAGKSLAPAQEFISLERIVFIDIDENVQSFSSSAVRDTIARIGLDSSDWKKFVLKEIAEYIEEHRLYSMS